MKKYLILAATALTMVACSNDSDSNVVNTNATIRLTTGVAGATRSTNQDLQSTQIASGQSVWVVFATQDNTEPNATAGTDAWTHTGTDPYVANAAYIADGSGTLAGATIHFPYASTTAKTISIKAYAPFGALPSGTQSVKTNQTLDADYLASDYLFGNKVSVSYDDVASPVLISFNHMLAKVIVNVSSTDDASPVSGAKVAFGDEDGTKNIIKDYTINADGSVTAGTTKDAIVMADALASDGKCAAIIVPQTVAAGGKLFTIKPTGAAAAKTYTLPVAKAFDGGKVYTYNVAIRSDNSLIILNETINQWDAQTPEGVIAN